MTYNGGKTQVVRRFDGHTRAKRAAGKNQVADRKRDQQDFRRVGGMRGKAGRQRTELPCDVGETAGGGGSGQGVGERLMHVTL